MSDIIENDNSGEGEAPQAGLSFSEILRRAQMSSPIRPSHVDDSVIDPQLLNDDSALPGLDDNNGGVQEHDTDFRLAQNSTPANVSYQAMAEAKRQRISQEVNANVNRLRLSNDSAQELRRFAMASEAEQRMRLYANTLSITEKQENAVATWTPNKNALKNIRKCAVRYLISPDVESYKSLTEKGVETLLDAVPQNGLPSGWKNNPAQSAIVRSAILLALTNARRDVKTVLTDSLIPGEDGKCWDIQRVAERLAKMGNIREESDTRHWARYAFLRNLAKESSDVKFYNSIDKQMAKMQAEARKKYGVRDFRKINENIHRTFINVLNIDLELHGYPDGVTEPFDPSHSLLAEDNDIEIITDPGMAGPSRKRSRL